MNDPTPTHAPVLGLLPYKTKASIIHLLISIAVVSAFVAFAALIWYPSPLLETSGLTDIVLILITVDLILGPALTFILFKPQKKGLKLDLSLVASVQIAALLYGMYTVYIAHPVYIVYNVDRFTLMTPVDVDPTQAQQPDLQVSGWWKPKLVVAQPPQDPALAQQIMFDAFAGKGDIDAHPELYQALEQATPTMLDNSIKPESLTSTPKGQQILTQFLTKHGKTAHDYLFFPLLNKTGDVVWVWDRASFTPIDALALDPWQHKTALTAQK